MEAAVIEWGQRRPAMLFKVFYFLLLLLAAQFVSTGLAAESIKMSESTQSVEINSGFNDAWFSPDTDGQGFFIIVFPQTRQVFLSWFTYDTERPPADVIAFLGEPGHRWLTAQGGYTGNQAVLEVWMTEGGVFDSAEPEPVRREDGEILLEFSGCNAGTVGYDIPSIGRQGVVAIERIVTDNVALCEELARPDFSHPLTPHVMSKNSFAYPTQLDQFDQMNPRIGTQPLMTILLEFPDSAHQEGRTESYFSDLIHGDDPSVNGYFKEVSYGNYSFSNAGVFGWFVAPQTAEYYFGESGNYNYTSVAAAAVEAAIDAGVQFDDFDTNGDGEITREELFIQMVFSSHPSIGKPWVMATRPDQTQAAGVFTPGGLEIDTWAVRGEENGSISLFAHELAHAALALPDLYSDDYGGDPSAYFTLMANTTASYTAHFSPWAKIHLGWIEPIVVARSGRYTIPAVEQNPVAYVLYDPEHGVDEYYILENRWPQLSQYENGLPDRGLAIWHITEFYDDEPFNFLKGRKMVAMKWAGGNSSLDMSPFTALWDCSESASCYDFTDTSSPRDSRWADGTSSGIEIRNIPDAGPMIEVDIVVP
jgi:M6 family metalloprotease-like protein